jgi:hypothetical protein
MDIGGWLRSLGLEKYEATFREAEIDAEVLSELTDQFADFTVAGLQTDKKISELVEQWQGLFELISQSVTLNVQFVELDGADHWFFAGDQQPKMSADRIGDRIRLTNDEMTGAMEHQAALLLRSLSLDKPAS